MGKYSEDVKRYIPIADAIAQMFGGNCEVTLHDLSSPQSSVIHTVNGHVTGSVVGQPLNHLLGRVLLSQKLKNDVLANYRTETDDKRPIKSTTAVLRNTQGEAIGALCIHMDMEPFAGIMNVLEEFVRTEDNQVEPVTENVAEVEAMVEEEFGSVVEIVDRLIARTISEQDGHETDKNTKLQWVRFMDKKGVFLIKGALEKVAAELKISKVTLYSYLDEIRSQKEEG